jgi:hypothetical protein
MDPIWIAVIGGALLAFAIVATVLVTTWIISQPPRRKD